MNTQKDRRNKLVKIYHILSTESFVLEHINLNKELEKTVSYAKINLKIIDVGKRYNKLSN